MTADSRPPSGAASVTDTESSPATTARRAAPESLLTRVFKSPRIMISSLFLVLIGLISLAAPLVAPQDPTKLLAKPLLEPSAEYPLGTDDFGRDALSRLIYAGRISLGVS
ncbi:MAG: ABC transporter, partial [Chloroflexota bacterium]